MQNLIFKKIPKPTELVRAVRVLVLLLNLHISPQFIQKLID